MFPTRSLEYAKNCLLPTIGTTADYHLLGLYEGMTSFLNNLAESTTSEFPDVFYLLKMALLAIFKKNVPFCLATSGISEIVGKKPLAMEGSDFRRA